MGLRTADFCRKVVLVQTSGGGGKKNEIEIVGCCHRIELDQIERKTLNKYRDVLFQVSVEILIQTIQNGRSRSKEYFFSICCSGEHFQK